ncbi:MAG TPA: glycogen debranching enzyme GlgX, partial [Burkholderiales bacterium]|nr:glycogen debranching enzyme GlgX [Burkholderiales bacterium]
NNNAYCQDNEISWVNWELGPDERAFLDFVCHVVRLRRQHPVFRRRSFLQGRPIRGSGVKDIVWLNPDGREMSDEEWSQSFARCLGVYLAGEGLEEQDGRGRPIRDEDFLLLFNAHHEEIPFILPGYRPGFPWALVLDTRQRVGPGGTLHYRAGDVFPLAGRSLALLSQVAGS